MFATRSLENHWRAAGAGAHYAHLTRNQVEDKIFHDDAENTQWKQNSVKYTHHQESVIVQGPQNAGLGKTMTANLTKSPDKLAGGFTVSSWPGLKPNVEAGITQSSYVNARALYANKGRKIRIATQPLFESEGHSQLVFMELMGIAGDYAKLIGLCYTKQQLIEESKFDTVLFDPWYGFPMQDSPSQSYNIGLITFHPIVFEQTNRGINELVINYDNVITKGRGITALPFEVSTGAVVSSSSVDFTLATKCVWLSKRERLSIARTYHEVMFKELLSIGEHSEAPCNTTKKVNIELSCKGPVTYLWLTIQAREDVAKGIWTKLCDDYGLDYIEQFMLITGTAPREDGLPAAFYRTVKVLETFKNSIDRHIYVLAFETNAKSKNGTGYQSFTNVEKLSLQLVVKPHKVNLDFKVGAAVINGVYGERGGGGKIWG